MSGLSGLSGSSDFEWVGCCNNRQASPEPDSARVLPVQKADKLEAYPTLKPDRPEALRAT